jgi:hypothetical protein
LDLPLQIAARDASVRFVQENMPTAARYHDRDKLLADMVGRIAVKNGCICEFGVYRGHTLKLMANTAPHLQVHGFDSFEGLPVDWRPGFAKGFFKTQIPKFRNRNIQLHVGLFQQTVPSFIDKLDKPITLAHIDCDLYSSTKCVLDNILPALDEHAVLVFDEYFNYPGWEQHEHRALREAIENSGLKVEYIAYNAHNEQVAVSKV